jgi:2-dehydropantoate 2-reductase
MESTRVEGLRIANVNNISIYGAETLGCYIGGHLLATGYHINFVAHSRIPSDIKKYGLSLSRYDGCRHHIAASAIDLTDDPSQLSSANLVVFTVRSAELHGAAQLLARVIKPNAIVLSMLPSVGAADLIRRYLPNHTVLEAAPSFNVASMGGATIHQGSPGRIYVSGNEKLAPYVNVFQAADLSLSMQEDILPALWTVKLWRLNDALNALSNLTLKEQFEQRTLRQSLALLQEETLRLMRLAAIEPVSISPWPAVRIPYLLRLPNILFGALSGSMFKFDSLAYSSMSGDLSWGSDTEVDWIQGDVIRLADRLGSHAPLNGCISRLVHSAERSMFRPIWSGTELLKELIKSKDAKMAS